MTDKIRITGQLIAKDDIDANFIPLTSKEAEACELNGGNVTMVNGVPHQIVIKPWQDGTLELHPKSDMRGRMMQMGGHSNAGYSGYFKGYIWQGGKRRVLKDFWKLFPKQEHHYAKQGDIIATFELIHQLIIPFIGRDVTKGAGGWYLFNESTK